jgi:Arc/MetJ family transcription regulator
VKSAHTAFKSSTALPRATQRAAVNSAMAVYLASPKSDADEATFKAAVHAARAAYKADPAVLAAQTAKHTAVSTARTAYQAAVKAARDAFFAATGHNPKHIRIVIPRV